MRLFSSTSYAGSRTQIGLCFVKLLVLVRKSVYFLCDLDLIVSILLKEDELNLPAPF